MDLFNSFGTFWIQPGIIIQNHDIFAPRRQNPDVISGTKAKVFFIYNQIDIPEFFPQKIYRAICRRIIHHNNL